MRHKVIPLAAVLFLLAACLAAARQDKSASPVSRAVTVGTDRELEVMQQALRAVDLQRYEDIEIMRRILADKLTGLSRGSFQGAKDVHGRLGVLFGDFAGDGWPDLLIANNQADPTSLYRNKGDGTFEDVTLQALADQAHGGVHGISTAEAVEGYYLKGTGVVYSVSLPVITQQLVKGPAKPARKPISQWERVSKELRGEKVEAQDKATEQRQDTVADVMLRLLAENGHHFHLPENEQLTVAITLRTQESCTKCHLDPHAAGGMMGGGGKGAMGGGMGMKGGMPGMMQQMMGGRAGGAGGSMADMMMRMGGPPAKGKGSSEKGGGAEVRDAEVLALTQLAQETNQEAQDSEAQNQALLGDLHMKQARYKDAVAAYKKALDANEKNNVKHGGAGPQSTPRAVRSQLTAVDLYNKLAQAHLALGDGDEVLTALRQLAQHAQQGELDARRAQEVQQLHQLDQELAKGMSRHGSAPSMALPSKLIVSAPKRVLDLVGAGKISFEEFRKAATVQYLTFANPKEGRGPGEAKGKPAASDDADKKP